MTREVPLRKRLEVLVRYVRGDPYDTITQATETSKGSVVNIVAEFRRGAVPGFQDLRQEVDALRELGVRLRKHGLSLPHAAVGLAFFQRLEELGIGPQAVEGWVDMCRKLSSADHPTEKVVDAAIRLLRAEAAAGLSYELVPHRFEERRAELAQLESSIEELRARLASGQRELRQVDEALAQKQKFVKAERRRLEEEVKQKLAQHDLTLEQVELLSRIVPEELRKAGLARQDVEKTIGQVRAFGSLAEATFRVEERKRLAEGRLAQTVQARAEAQKAVARLSSSVKGLKRQAARLGAEVSRKEMGVGELSRETEAMRADIDLVKRWLGFLSNPRQVASETLDGLMADFQDLSLRRKGWYEMRDVYGTIIWKSRLPPTTPEAEISEDLRRRTMEALLPIIEVDYEPGIRIVCHRCGGSASMRWPAILARPGRPAGPTTSPPAA